MPGEKRRGVRELPLTGAGDLAGSWVASGWTGAFSTPPSPLGFCFFADDAILLGEALAKRGASLSRLGRRFARIEGRAYHAFSPLSRAVHEILPLDAQAFALAEAGEAYAPAGKSQASSPSRERKLSLLTFTELTLRSRSAMLKLERRISHHERDAEQHYRWLLEMDLGILPDDALGTTLEECLAVQRTTRGLELEVTLELLGTFTALLGHAERHELPLEAFSMAALAVDALELPSATPALAFSSAARSFERASAPQDPSVFSLFLESFGERGPNEREPLWPRWREDPARLMRMAELLMRGTFAVSDQRLARARREREGLLQQALARSSRLEQPLFRTLLSTTKQLVLLRSRLHRVRARIFSMVRTAVLDVDRRLGRLIGSNPNDAFFLEPEELLVSTVRPRRELAALALERRRAWSKRRESAAPPALVGREAYQVLSAGPSESARDREVEPVLGGIGVGHGVTEDVTGPVFVAQDFDEALAMPPHAVLVLRSLDVGWAPLWLATAAVVTDAGGLLDEGAITAASLGVPFVVGTRDATLKLVTGSHVRINVRDGSVCSLKTASR